MYQSLFFFFFLALSTFSLPAGAQNSWTIDAGISAPWGVSVKQDSYPVESQASPLPAVTARFQWSFGTHVHMGIGAGFSAAKFSGNFTNDFNNRVFIDYQNTSLNLMPVVGVSMGRSGVVQLNLIPTWSIPFAVKENVRSGFYNGKDWDYSESVGHISHSLFGVGMELQEQIKLNPAWRLTISETVQFNITGLSRANEPPSWVLYANYWSVRIGACHLRKKDR